jgi:ABC-type uncharacterized transport system ATPase subunit
MRENEPVLEMSGIHKQFPGFKALSNVTFRMFTGGTVCLSQSETFRNTILMSWKTRKYPTEREVKRHAA